ncbi:hypothetical protein JYU34_018670 [Plutella xylostella]|uniref:Uncharacterized protein n=1 Tax=Plutella xylostella TaxID=51655 RepID=A0ABQ7PZJ8_PLUXY|nr:hypothetical protein JYU34_018670 [Plutella xylostella]
MPPKKTRKVSKAKSRKRTKVKMMKTKSESNKLTLEGLVSGVHEKKITCKECSKKFKFKSNYEKHVRTEHCNLPDCVKCDLCPARCPNDNILAEHKANAHERPMYECSTCSKIFSRPSHVFRHSRLGCGTGVPEQYPCEICNKSFSRKDNLLVHLRSHIKLNKPFQCKHCQFAAHTFRRYVNHVQKVHWPKYFECDHCGKSTTSRPALMKHLEIHGDKKFACEVCGYTSHTIEVMRRHVLRHTDEKPFKCSQCPRSFIQSAQLRRHMESHLNFLCKECDKTFRSHARLQIHMREHNGLAPLLCSFEDCPYSKRQFSSEQIFIDHMKAHEDRKFQCTVCHKKYATEINLKRHTSTHELERPRRCMYCVTARAYIRGDMLVRHVRSKHPAIFNEYLLHVRQVLGTNDNIGQVRRSELDSILNLLDAVSDRILDEHDGSKVLFAGMETAVARPEVQVLDIQTGGEDDAASSPEKKPETTPGGHSALMSEAQLSESVRRLLAALIDMHTLEELGWPGESVDVLLEKVITQCDGTPADRGRWSRVQRLRENCKQLFLRVVEDASVRRMLETHTIDQVVAHILDVSEEDHDTGMLVDSLS